MPSLRCLIVEDQPEISFILRRFLQGLISTEAVATAEQAIPLLRSTTYDMLIFDINLGAGITGIDLMRAIRSDPRYARTPIIAFTAAIDTNRWEELISRGFDDVLSKPFSRDEVQLIVRKHLAKLQSAVPHDQHFPPYRDG